MSKYDYTNDAIGRCTQSAWSGTAFTQGDTVAYGYNTRNEVTSATAANNAAYAFAYQYDPIGNRQTYTNDGNPATTYTANQLNQYTALQQGAGTVNPTYDADGNMTRLVVPPSGGPDWSLTWDGENRLVAAESATARIEFVYDYMSRRVEKKAYTGTPGNWTLQADTKFLYDSWNLALELDSLNANATLQTFTWGLDLSQSLQGAGGVGGLLAVYDAGDDETYFPLFDANGNVSEYLDSTGAVAAHYEFDPFGGTTVASGDHAANFAHRFSTKFLDAENGLYYYGYRFYSPELGRWASRDPVGERSGDNVLAFLRNSPLLGFDVLGLTGFVGPEPEPGAPKWPPNPPEEPPPTPGWHLQPQPADPGLPTRRCEGNCVLDCMDDLWGQYMWGENWQSPGLDLGLCHSYVNACIALIGSGIGEPAAAPVCIAAFACAGFSFGAEITAFVSCNGHCRTQCKNPCYRYSPGDVVPIFPYRPTTRAFR